jgi:hypothetical protein
VVVMVAAAVVVVVSYISLKDGTLILKVHLLLPRVYEHENAGKNILYDSYLNLR